MIKLLQFTYDLNDPNLSNSHTHLIKMTLKKQDCDNLFKEKREPDGCTPRVETESFCKAALTCCFPLCCHHSHRCTPNCLLLDLVNIDS